MKTPHCCPVCNGNGLVPNGFYNQTSGQWSSSSITPEKCRSCKGSGIVWNENETYQYTYEPTICKIVELNPINHSITQSLNHSIHPSCSPES